MQDTTDTTSPIAAPADAQPSPAPRPHALPPAVAQAAAHGVHLHQVLLRGGHGVLHGLVGAGGTLVDVLDVDEGLGQAGGAAGGRRRGCA